MSPSAFERELAAVINRHSVENQSNTPDWVLAHYLVECLAAWEHATAQREHWYGEQMRPGGMGEVAS